MYSLILTITLLANQPQGSPEQFLKVEPVAGLQDETDCKRLIPYAVSYWVRHYAELGQYVRVVADCAGPIQK